MEKFEIVIIGGGPAGYVSAIRAAQLNKKVLLIEKEQVGGVCLNSGCIPTKSLLKSAALLDNIRRADQYGINVGSIDFNIHKMVERSHNISKQLATGIRSVLKKNKVSLIEGSAYLEKNNIINITQGSHQIAVEAKKIIVATGARPRTWPDLIANHGNIWTSKEALNPTETPKSLIIIGSGAIGIEFASFYNALGTKITVIEAKPHILPLEDLEISNEARKIFERKNMSFHTNATVLQINENKSNVIVEVQINDQKLILEADKLLLAIGIVPNVKNIGLENYNINFDNSHIITNEFMQTSDSTIYAIGDVTAGPWLAHKASHQGIIAAEHISGLKTHKINNLNIPSCTYSLPHIASVGLTEEAARLKNLKVKVGKFPFIANGKALLMGETEGFIKTIFDAKTGELLGAHMIGHEVSELIQGYVIAKNLEATEIDLINTIFAHPTLSEMMHESVLAAYNRIIHF